MIRTDFPPDATSVLAELSLESQAWGVGSVCGTDSSEERHCYRYARDTLKLSEIDVSAFDDAIAHTLPMMSVMCGLFPGGEIECLELSSR